MVEVRQTDVYAQWFGGLRDRQARARIDARIRRTQDRDIQTALELARDL